jgi:hypothetical protein
MHFLMTAMFLFLFVIPVLIWNNGVPGVAAIQPLISGEFCHSARDCLLSQVSD